MTEEQTNESLIKQVFHRLHRLEDELAGFQTVTKEVKMENMVNRFEHARQEVLEIIRMITTRPQQ